MGKSCLCLFHHGTVIGEYHDLWQIANGHVLLASHGSTCRFLYARNNLEHGTLAGTILANKCYPVLWIYNEVHVCEQWSRTELHGKIVDADHKPPTNSPKGGGRRPGYGVC